MSEEKETEVKQDKKKRPAWVRFVLIPFAWVFGSLLALFILLLIFAGPVAEIVAEKVVPAVTGLHITVDDITVKPFRGRIELRDFILYNPENKGYSSKFAIAMGQVDLEVNIASLFSSKKTIVRDVTVKDIQINYETDLLLNSNLQDILNQLKKDDGKKKEEKKKAKKEKKTAEQEPGLQLDHFVFENVGLFIVSKGMTSSGIGIPMTIPDIGPIGDDREYGVTPVELSIELMYQIVKNALKCAGSGISSGTSNATDSIKDTANSLWDKITK